MCTSCAFLEGCSTCPVNSFRPPLILKNWIGLQMQRQKIPPSILSFFPCLLAPSAGWIWQMSFAICKDCERNIRPLRLLTSFATSVGPVSFCCHATRSAPVIRKSNPPLLFFTRGLAELRPRSSGYAIRYSFAFHCLERIGFTSLSAIGQTRKYSSIAIQS